MRKFASWLIVGAWFLIVGIWFFTEKLKVGSPFTPPKVESPSNPSNPSTPASQPPVSAPSDSQSTPEAPASEASEPEALATVQKDTKTYPIDMGMVPCYHTVLGKYGIPLDGTLLNLCREYHLSDEAEKESFYLSLVEYQYQVVPHELTGMEIWVDSSREGTSLIKYVFHLQSRGFFSHYEDFYWEEFAPGNYLIYLPSEHKCYVITQFSLDEFVVFHLTCMYQPDPAFTGWPSYDMNTGEWTIFHVDSGLDNK